MGVNRGGKALEKVQFTGDLRKGALGLIPRPKPDMGTWVRLGIASACFLACNIATAHAAEGPGTTVSIGHVPAHLTFATEGGTGFVILWPHSRQVAEASLLGSLLTTTMPCLRLGALLGQAPGLVFHCSSALSLSWVVLKCAQRPLRLKDFKWS